MPNAFFLIIFALLAFCTIVQAVASGISIYSFFTGKAHPPSWAKKLRFAIPVLIILLVLSSAAGYVTFVSSLGSPQGAGNTATPTLGEATPSPTTEIATPTTFTGPYQDPLTNPKAVQTSKAQWQQNSTCAFKADGYHVMISQATYQSAYCYETGYIYQNATLSIDVKIGKGSQAALLFRTKLNSPGTLFGYKFQIDVKQGCYSLGKYNQEGVLQDTTCSPIIHTGPQATNSLKVVLSGSTLKLFANGTALGTPITDKDNSFDSGGIALLAEAEGSGTAVDVTFSNLTVSA